ncbi:MAG: imidazole glycerol phosphate synthase [Ectobacillus sp.]
MADRDFDRNLYRDREDEEYAAEVTPARVPYERRDADPTTGGAVFGYIALALAILSFFTFPVFFGIGAVILGFFAASRGARTTGRFAIILGAIAAVMALFFRIALASFILSMF